MFYYLKIFFDIFFFNKHEKLFIKSINFKSDNFSVPREKVFLEITPDYFFLAYYSCIFNDRLKNYEIIGYWPDIMKYQGQERLSFDKIKSSIYQYLLKRKWQKLYSHFGIKKFYSFDDISSLITEKEKKKINKNSNKIFNKIKKPNHVLKIKIDNLVLGDLIYDTYIRSTGNYTIDINDKTLKKIIKESEILLIGIKKIIISNKIKVVYLPYSTYTAHGVVARVGVSLNNEVYTYGNYQYNKKLSKRDLRHVENFNEFKNIFKIKKNKKEKLNISKNLIQNFFFHKNQKKLKQLYSYMEINSYQNKNKQKNKFQDYDIAIFLPNFFEAQREWGEIIFNDFYEWIIFTLDFFTKSKIKICIKPHPNSFTIHRENIELIKKLKKDYSHFIWLDTNTPNKEIFDKIKLAISPWGSVLWELAYFQIPCISIGDNPGKLYNLSFNPKNINEYKYLLENYKKLKSKVNKKSIYEFVYVYMINNNDSFKNIARKIDLRSIDLNVSSGLDTFIKKFKKHKKLWLEKKK